MIRVAPFRWGAIYQTYNRGVNRESTFFEERDYRCFLRLYARHAAVKPKTSKE